MLRLYHVEAMLSRRLFAAGLVVIACFTVRPSTGVGAATDFPARLTDPEFWTLTEQLSEPNGSFRSDNFLSNERGYQTVIPGLVGRIKAGGAYIGVGPEQNFPYIVGVASRASRSSSTSVAAIFTNTCSTRRSSKCRRIAPTSCRACFRASDRPA